MVAPSHLAAFDENKRHGRSLRDGGFVRDPSDGQRIEINHVDADVDDADQQNPQQQRARQNALRILDFAGNPGDVNPSVIGPENGDQRDAEAGNHVRQRSRLIERQIDRVVRP